MIDQTTIKNTLKRKFREGQKLSPQQIFYEFISIDEDDQEFIGSLRNSKKSTCGKKIECSTLSFQCFDCAPDPHHMFCPSCFVLSKHEGHKFLMRHNIGGCCDCGDEMTVSLKGCCSNHQGLSQTLRYEQYTRIPQQLSSIIASFIRTIILYYYKNIQKSGLNYPTGLFKCETVLRAMMIKDQYVQGEINYLKYNESTIKKQELGVYLYNICFNFIEWLIDSNMPFIVLITELLMEIPSCWMQDELNLTYSDDTFLDLIVKSAAIVDNGQIKSKNLDSILYTLHANGSFKSILQQSMIKQYKHLKIYKMQNYGEPEKKLDLVHQQIKSTRGEQLILLNLLTKVEVLQTVKNYLQDLKVNQSSAPKTLIKYQAELHSHHAQFVSIDLQGEFFSSPYINQFYDCLGQSYASLTQTKILEYTFGYELNWLKLRTEYSFFPEILLKQLVKWLSRRQFTQLSHGNLLQEQFIITDEFANNFVFTRILQAYSVQEPADVYSEDLFDTPKAGVFYVLSYLYIQQNILNVLFNAFIRVINSSDNLQFNLNLSVVMLKFTYRLLLKRNLIDNDVQRYLVLIDDDRELPMTGSMKDNMFQAQLIRMARLLTANATLIDRAFTYFLVATYFQSKLDRDQFLQFLELIFDQGIQIIMGEIWQAMDRAIQSYFAAHIGGHQDPVYKLYNNGSMNQSTFTLQSHDMALIKMFLYLSDDVDKFCKSMEKQSCQLQDIHFIKHKLILELLLSDQDLLNLAGPLFKELPQDLKNFFGKFIRTIFMQKAYHNFDSLKQICISSGISKSLMIKDFILDVCDLDGFVRSLKLKSIYHNQNVYEPVLLQNCPDVKGAITEKLLETNATITIDPTLGNGVVNDFMYQPEHELATMGCIRLTIWRKIFKCPDIFQLLFSDFLITNQRDIMIPSVALRRMLQTVYIFIKAGNIFELHSQQKDQLNILINQLKNNNTQRGQNIQSDGQLDEGKTDELFKLLEESLCQQTLIQQESYEIQINEKLNQKTLDNKAKLQKKFFEKQKLFQKQQESQDKGQSQMFSVQLDPKQSAVDETQEKYDICQGCKLQIEPNQEQCLPCLLDQNNDSTYFSFIQEEFPITLTVLSSCKHRFHSECLKNTYQNQKINQAPIWLQLQCPVCKQAITSVIPFILRINDDNQIKCLIKDYFDQILAFVNTNKDASLHYFNRQVEITDLQDLQNVIFFECNISIIKNMFIEMFLNPLEFFKKGDDEVLANIIKIVTCVKRQLVVHQEKIHSYLDELYQQYRPINHFVGQQVAILIASLLDIMDCDDGLNLLQVGQNQKLQNFMTQDQNITQSLNFLVQSTIQMIFYQSYSQKDKLKPDQIISLNNLNMDHKQQFFELLKNRLGKTFKQLYMKYIQVTCKVCAYFPQLHSKDSSADLMVCLLCEAILCTGKCNNFKSSKFGNLNTHAQDFHCSQSMFISITTGYTSIVVSPITRLNYKNLFFDSLGQKVEILNHKINWDDYRLDEREITHVVDVLISNRLKQVVRNEIGQEHSQQDLENNFDFSGIY